MYDVPCVPSGIVYRKILETGLQHCGSVLFVVRKGLPISDDAKRVITLLSEFKLRSAEESQWPGTVLLGETATVYRYLYNYRVFEILRDSASSFLDWHQPALPEDLCLLRHDESPWFVTISHEGDCYFDLADGETAAVEQAVPEMGKLSIHVDQEPLDDDDL